ncbi:hypothetical protein DPEC_G00306060 [Dallia pectoralis]|uniref:Uncharacterized protein n=1 Tax=Dallia pectoralis TaxID=75939 RepID=A0ACC2FEC5_DALPE|nr:hypothetical protein DPEC_G00306060 [Dallia pectoralis]
MEDNTYKRQNPMTAMTCKWNGFFNVGEDFDDEDLLEIDWSAPNVPVTSGASTAQSCVLRTSPAVPIGQKNVPQSSTALISTHRTLSTGSGPESMSSSTSSSTTGCPAALGLRQISTSERLRPFPPPHLPSLSRELCIPPKQISAPPQETHSDTGELLGVASNQDDFDDWDVDLADLDESDPQMVTETPAQEKPPATAPCTTLPTYDTVSPAKRLRTSACGGVETMPCVGLRSISSNQMSGLSERRHHRSPLAVSFPGSCPRAEFFPAPLQSPVVPVLNMPSSPFSTPILRHVTPRLVRGPPSQAPRPYNTPLVPGHSLPVTPTSSGRLGEPMSSPGLTPRSLHTPVFTNHLVRLVSNSNKPPQRPRSEQIRQNMRRFPGPAGMLPQQQVQGQSLDDIVVAIPQTPAHGALARMASQVPSSQTEEEDFTGGPWAAMKLALGLDERNPSCFLHSYSVAMVLRKAALKQLAKNKVPNMAVVLKSIIHTHADAKAVFRDPTGEIQGTVHRRLLEDRLGELKTGAVLLLKQVGVFSPSHRNHYLNVTPNNLLRIYAPDGSSHSPLDQESLLVPSDQSIRLLGASVAGSSDQSTGLPEDPASWMELLFDEADEKAETESRLGPAVGLCSGSQVLPAAPPNQSWDTDDLDELLGELPVESYCL